ncbi:MAG: hypothetical protein K8F54_10635 [Altibacter sp.]|uniref:hypothetical protein n=1 Tax=Altibacter sp. TaxID=2024823 RepID=UPI001DF17460|nr:hypothetical protein [Altibacter sp.]MBZ0328051.1 hypothetical protein [Altibacter sp.]
MKKKDDIGVLLKEKLAGIQKSPDAFLWNKINTTLDQEGKKRRRLMYLWFTGVGIGSLFLLFFVFSPSLTRNNTTETPPIEDVTSIPAEKASKSNRDVSSKEDNTVLPSNASETAPNEMKLDVPEKNTSEENTKKKTRTDRKQGNQILLDSVTTYRYYNSSDGTQVETTDKRIIDSLLINSKKIRDTIPNKTVDSI